MGFSVMLRGAEKLVPVEYWCLYGKQIFKLIHFAVGTHGSTKAEKECLQLISIVSFHWLFCSSINWSDHPFLILKYLGGGGL